MSPLEIDVLSPQGDKWIRKAKVMPGKNGSMSHNKSDGSRVIYLFECKPGDNESEISISKLGVDIVTSKIREIRSVDIRVVATLKDEESKVLVIKTDVSSTAKAVRLTHLKGSNSSQIMI